MLDNQSKRNLYLQMILTAVAVVLYGLLLWRFDFEILFFIKDHRTAFLDTVVPFYTSLGDEGIIWIVLGLLLLIPKKTRKCGIMVLGALLVMLVIIYIYIQLY